MSTTEETVSFEKYNGTSNDFIVVDANSYVPDRQAFAATYTDRQTGAGADRELAAEQRPGADGVLFLALEDAYSPPRVIMTLVQPDGSVAEMCGNGARIAATWASKRTGSDEIMIDAPAGSYHASIDGDDVTIEMGEPEFDPREVPVARDEPLVTESMNGLEVTAVNTGVPHAVAFVDDVDAVDLESVAPAIRHADVFPEGANVTVASRDGDGFAQRTYERGVEGETQSCGTGAVAVAAVAKRLGLVSGEDPVPVRPPGGELVITVPDDGPATLTGPVAFEFGGVLPRRPPVSL